METLEIEDTITVAPPEKEEEEVEEIEARLIALINA